MRNKTLKYLTLMALAVGAMVSSCTTNDVLPEKKEPTENNVKIADKALGPYLYFLGASGVTREIVDADTTYFVDTVKSLSQVGDLNLSKSAGSITTLGNAGVPWPALKIVTVEELKFFPNITGLTLTSNEILKIDLSKQTQLTTLTLNNNWIEPLDLSANNSLVTLSYTGSARAPIEQRLTNITWPTNNTVIRAVTLTGHTNTPFSVPSAIWNILTTKAGVVEYTPVDNRVKIQDKALAPYLFYLQVSGVTREISGVDTTYYVDKVLSLAQEGALNLSKASAYITTLRTASVPWPGEKIKSFDELKYFPNITSLTLTSNELTTIDLTQLTKLETLTLNNNFIEPLNLSANNQLITLGYTGSVNTPVAQRLTNITWPTANTVIRSVTLTGHANSPFTVPAAIYDILTTRAGVVTTPVDNRIVIQDKALAPYLYFLNASGVTREIGVDTIYYVDPTLSSSQTRGLNLSKAAAYITTLGNAGVPYPSLKIVNFDELKYFPNITSLTLTSNTIQQIDLLKNTQLDSLTLNNNLIGSLDLSKNTLLTYLSYNASGSATAAQKLTAIDLSNNLLIKYLSLTSHLAAGSKFTIPAAIYDQLSTAQKANFIRGN